MKFPDAGRTMRCRVGATSAQTGKPPSSSSAKLVYHTQILDYPGEVLRQGRDSMASE